MLRISIVDHSEDGIRFQLEGKLVGAWVEELRRLSGEALTRRATLSLDLEKVLYADSHGIALLRNLRERHVVQLNCSAFISQQLREAADDAHQF